MRRVSSVGILVMIGVGFQPKPVVAQSATCAGATLILANDSVSFDNSASLNAPNPAFECIDASGPPAGAVWYRFVATHSTARLSTCNSAADDSTFAIYDSCAATAAIGRGEDECGTSGRLGDECIGGLIVGATYFVQVAAWSPDHRGSYTLEVQSPCPAVLTNLGCFDAQEIGCGNEVTFDNTGLSHAPLPCYSCANGPDHTGTLWYKFTATHDSAVISTCNSTAPDSTLAVYSGSCDQLVEVGCGEDDCGASTFLSSATANGLVVGETYYVQVSAWQPASRGSYTLEVQCQNGSPGEIVPLVNGEAPRSLSFEVLPATIATAGQIAIGLRMSELQNPQPPNAPCCPPPDFGAYLTATCSASGEDNACVRWVGPLGLYLESQDNALLGSLRAARLQCTPYYHDWASEAGFSVFGPEIVPSSTYDVVLYGSSCKGVEPVCTNLSPPAQMMTRRWGDVVAPFNPPNDTEPAGGDVVELVNKFKNLDGTKSKSVDKIFGNVVEVGSDVGGLEISGAVDAFKGLAYPYSGPCACPSTVPCNSIACASAASCSGGLCTRTCVGGVHVGLACLTEKHCNVCVGGSSDGLPCDPADVTPCPGGACSNDSVCGAGFCRDRCGRCHN